MSALLTTQRDGSKAKEKGRTHPNDQKPVKTKTGLLK
jgi:hypothetical protein